MTKAIVESSSKAVRDLILTGPHDTNAGHITKGKTKVKYHFEGDIMGIRYDFEVHAVQCSIFVAIGHPWDKCYPTGGKKSDKKSLLDSTQGHWNLKKLYTPIHVHLASPFVWGLTGIS